MTSKLLLSVVIPAYNEIETLELILQKVQNVPINKEIIIIDRTLRVSCFINSDTYQS